MNSKTLLKVLDTVNSRTLFSSDISTDEINDLTDFKQDLRENGQCDVILKVGHLTKEKSNNE